MSNNIYNVQFWVVILDPYTNVKLDVINGYSFINSFIIHTSLEYLTKVQFALGFAMRGKEGMAIGRAVIKISKYVLIDRYKNQKLLIWENGMWKCCDTTSFISLVGDVVHLINYIELL